MMNQKAIAPHITGDLMQINFSIDSFKDVREENFLYVDKTKMIEDLLTYDHRKVVLLTRPRRFGKSLNLSMLRYFFDKTEDTKELFKGLYIEQSKYFGTHLNQYPVMYLNFKDVKIKTAEDVEEGLIRSVSKTLRRLYQKYQFEELKNISIETKSGDMDPAGVQEITEILNEKTGRRVIVLVDEYDSVINRAYGTDGWKKAAEIVKELFGALFKSNEYLEMGVLTGVSRIGKELGFSDMNNLAVYGLTNKLYYEYFGFTEDEVNELLRLNEINISELFYRMYNGYHLGDTPNMFNPSSILQFLAYYQRTREENLASYWINASTNRILKDNIAKQDMVFKDKLLTLLDGGTITEPVFASVDYEMLDKPSYMFSLLIDTGYLCPVGAAGGDAFDLKIPNEEVLYGYRDMIDLITGTDGTLLEKLCSSLLEGKIERFEKTLNEILLSAASFHDFGEKENSYHNLVMGALLYLLGRFRVDSNRESGAGRYDIAVIPSDYTKGKYRPIIIEFKAASGDESHSREDNSDKGNGKNNNSKAHNTNKGNGKAYSTDESNHKVHTEDGLMALAKEALEQIESRQYAAGYAPEYKKEDFLLVGIGAHGKRCRVAAK